MPKPTKKVGSHKTVVAENLIPEPIRLMLEARGWHFPPTKEEIRQKREALKRFAGSVKTDPETLYAVASETDPTRLGLTMEDLEELRRRVEKDACRGS